MKDSETLVSNTTLKKGMWKNSSGKSEHIMKWNWKLSLPRTRRTQTGDTATHHNPNTWNVSDMRRANKGYQKQTWQRPFRNPWLSQSLPSSTLERRSRRLRSATRSHRWNPKRRKPSGKPPRKSTTKTEHFTHPDDTVPADSTPKRCYAEATHTGCLDQMIIRRCTRSGKCSHNKTSINKMTQSGPHPVSGRRTTRWPYPCDVLPHWPLAPASLSMVLRWNVHHQSRRWTLQMLQSLIFSYQVMACALPTYKHHGLMGDSDDAHYANIYHSEVTKRHPLRVCAN